MKEDGCLGIDNAEEEPSVGEMIPSGPQSWRPMIGGCALESGGRGPEDFYAMKN